MQSFVFFEANRTKEPLLSNNEITVIQGQIHVNSVVALVETAEAFCYAIDCREKYPSIILATSETEQEIILHRSESTITRGVADSDLPTSIQLSLRGDWLILAETTRYTVYVFGIPRQTEPPVLYRDGDPSKPVPAQENPHPLAVAQNLYAQSLLNTIFTLREAHDQRQNDAFDLVDAGDELVRWIQQEGSLSGLLVCEESWRKKEARTRNRRWKQPTEQHEQ